LTKQDGISVIVCCHNSINRLKPTLEHLFQQSVVSDLLWEIIVVDNNSADATSMYAQELYQGSGSKIPFRVLQEAIPGLSHARNRGFESAHFNIALMVDDDNSICPTYVERVYELFSDPAVGMVGGMGIPVFEKEKPDWFEKYDQCYATGPQVHSEQTEVVSLYGAGLALRLDVLTKIQKHGFKSLLSDRVGNSLLSGGDTELCLAFKMAGCKLIYDESLTFEHHLPSGRLSWKYLRRLFYGFGFTKARLDIYNVVLSGRMIEDEGKIPMWLNRTAYLMQQILGDLPILAIGLIRTMEGNDLLLKALAKVGHIHGIVKSRKDYRQMHFDLAELCRKLKNG
jgi:glycosyltransferase involved in cell wall biosynthesis